MDGSRSVVEDLHAGHTDLQGRSNEEDPSMAPGAKGPMCRWFHTEWSWSLCGNLQEIPRMGPCYLHQKSDRRCPHGKEKHRWKIPKCFQGHTTACLESLREARRTMYIDSSRSWNRYRAGKQQRGPFQDYLDEMTILSFMSATKFMKLALSPMFRFMYGRSQALDSASIVLFLEHVHGSRHTRRSR